MSSNVEGRVFAEAISPNNVKTLEHAFPDELARAINIGAMAEFEKDARSRLREMMVDANQPTRRLFQIASEAAPVLANAHAILDSGDVAAVDGTDAMEQIAFNMTSAYACAVGFVTAKTRGKPAIRLTTTSTRYAEKGGLKKADPDELAVLCGELEESRIEQSWPTTFREYEERKLALECRAPWVLIDGPIYTQNLVTQQAGRDLYEELARSSQHFVGVIKDLSGSWVLSKWCGASLEQGEGFVVAPVRSQFDTRFSKRGEALASWLKEMPTDYVRVVFRPSQKAFGLECRVGDLPMAMALIVANASPTINHELPLLLETIDAHMRASCRASELKAAVISRIQQIDYRSGVDLKSERDFR